MFGRKAKLRKAIAKAFADDDHAPIEALPADLRASGYYGLTQELVDDEQYAAAKVAVDRAIAIAPDEIELHKLATTIARELGDLPGAIAAQQRVVAAVPRDIKQSRLLAELLISTEQLDDAIALLSALRHTDDHEVQVLLAEALFHRGEAEEALALLDPICAEYDALVRARKGLTSQGQHAMRVRDDIYASLHGREATIELAAAAGNLDASAGVNFQLLGAHLASTSERVADVLELQDPDTTERRARTYGPKSALGLSLVGISELRRGDVSAARTCFERACELDGRCFAAFYGLGAVLDHDKHDLHRRADRLPNVRDAPPQLTQVVSDWSALTEAERRVVWASIGPFRAFLPQLAEREVTMRVLPIDVRATDIGLFEQVAGKRASDDHRSYDALGGVATIHGAVAKIEGLLDIASDHGWTFAHEFAHLVYFHLDDARAAPFMLLFEKAREVGYATTLYALSNDDELFAVSYTEYLRRRYGLGDALLTDDAGVQHDLMSYFDELCATAGSTAGPFRS